MTNTTTNPPNPAPSSRARPVLAPTHAGPGRPRRDRRGPGRLRIVVGLDHHVHRAARRPRRGRGGAGGRRGQFPGHLGHDRSDQRDVARGPERHHRTDHRDLHVGHSIRSDGGGHCSDVTVGSCVSAFGKPTSSSSRPALGEPVTATTVTITQPTSGSCTGGFGGAGGFARGGAGGPACPPAVGSPVGVGPAPGWGRRIPRRRRRVRGGIGFGDRGQRIDRYRH